MHAGQLKVGDELSEDDGGTLTITAAHFNPEAPISFTYNLTVADTHTYFVGEDGVLVHNGKRKAIAAGLLFWLGDANPYTFDGDMPGFGAGNGCPRPRIMDSRPPPKVPPIILNIYEDSFKKVYLMFFIK